MRLTNSFRVGDLVVYRPSRRGYLRDVNSPERLVPGRIYRIVRIEQGAYIVVDGYTHPGGGLYWSEFSEAGRRYLTKFSDSGELIRWSLVIVLLLLGGTVYLLRS